MRNKCLIIVFVLGVCTIYGYGVIQKENGNQHKRIMELIKVLGTRHRMVAVEKLVAIGEPAVEPLIKALTDYSNSWLRPNAASVALGRIGTQKAEEGLSKALDNPEVQVGTRKAIIRALGEIGSTTSKKTLLKIIKTGKRDAQVRGEAIYVLGSFKSKQVEDICLHYLESEEEIIRFKSIKALCKICGDRYNRILISKLTNNVGYITDESIRNCLVKKGSPGAVKILLTALLSDKFRIWLAAAKALAEIGAPAIDLIVKNLRVDTNGTFRWRMVWVLSKIKSPTALSTLSEGLKDEDWRVRNEAALALSKMDSNRVIPVLKKLERHSPDYTREEINWVLKNIK
jgi:HEAT repeat protein